MELLKWKELIQEFLPSCCYRFVANIRCCVKAVDAELKPSYMFDLAFVPLCKVVAWLKRLHDVGLVHCRLSVIAIEQHLFIVNRSTIKRRLRQSTLGNERVVVVDVSSDLQQPQLTSTEVYQMVIDYSLQVVFISVPST